MYVQLRPVGFIAVMRGKRPMVSVRLFRWFAAVKSTRDELFSERYGHAACFRLAGLTLTLRRVSTYP